MTRYLTFKALKIGKSIKIPTGNGEILRGRETFKSEATLESTDGEKPLDTEGEKAHKRKQHEHA